MFWCGYSPSKRAAPLYRRPPMRSMMVTSPKPSARISARMAQGVPLRRWMLMLSRITARWAPSLVALLQPSTVRAQDSQGRAAIWQCWALQRWRRPSVSSASVDTAARADSSGLRLGGSRRASLIADDLAEGDAGYADALGSGTQDVGGRRGKHYAVYAGLVQGGVDTGAR